MLFLPQMKQMEVNLISDTITKPTPAMLDAMMRAKVGDDVFREDPSVNLLEEKAADMLGMEAALFCPSGTMTNQIAIKMHTRPLDELICEYTSHVYQYEVAGYAFHSGVGVNLIHGQYGKISAEQLVGAYKNPADWLPKSTLVVLENTTNKGGGNYYTIEEIIPIRKTCNQLSLNLHLDGARLFHALVETKDKPEDFGRLFDSISICLSKGLGAPVGSLLLGSKSFVTEARRIRKVMGGGMRQAGFLAAAGIFALDNHVERLITDHQHARKIALCLEHLDYVAEVKPVKTNIIIFDLKHPWTSTAFLAKLEEKGVKASAFGPATIRFVTHLDISQKMIDHSIEVLKSITF
jgi:threonine aldolase